VTAAQRKLRRDALAILGAAINAADAGNAVRRHLSIRGHMLAAGPVKFRLVDFDRIFVLAVGKASVEMAHAIEEILGERLHEGLAVTKRGHQRRRLHKVQVVEAAHPIPDKTSLGAANRVRELLAGLNARDLLIVAISGGASALLTAPAHPLTLADKQKTTDLLLRAGAGIAELNAVRKHLSMLKGGRLAALAYPATVLTLLLSDVIGDPWEVIGSGPTAPDSSTFSDAIAILSKYRLLSRMPGRVRAYLEAGSRGLHPETPKALDPLFRRVHHVVAGSNRLALGAAAAAAKKLGYRTLLLSSSMQGEAREVAQVHAQILRETVSSGNPIHPPACILSGGETTVTVCGPGMGGRNQEFALAAGIAIAGLPNALALSAGTDGSDGPTDAAGALANGTTIARAARIGFDAHKHLRENDSYAFFDAVGDLIRTGPTGTNVMDIHLLLAG
jgi:hydroxypyruvate reductase